MSGSDSTGRYALRFLHISDLHCQAGRERESWRRRRVLGDHWRRNLDTLLSEEGALDFVFFTGDAADWGLAAEYQEATEFFEKLREDLGGLSRDRIFVVPGNHDIDRKAEPDTWLRMRAARTANADYLGLSRWMNRIDPRSPMGFGPAWRDRILERQRHYFDWVRDGLKRPQLATETLGYRETVTLPAWPFPIHIIGLDTAWLCGDNSEAAICY